MPVYVNPVNDNFAPLGSRKKAIDVDELPTCFFCCEQAVLQTETEPYVSICSVVNHPDYAYIAMVDLKKK